MALGATRRDLVGASIVRWTLTAVVAAAVCAVAVVAASPIGPVGIGRRGPWTHGISVDWTVLAVGVPAVLALVIGAGAASARRQPARPRGVTVSVPGPPPVAAGTMLALRGVRGGAGVPIVSAVAGIAVAVAVLVAVAAGASSIREVTSNPVRFGADFDAIVADVGDGEEDQEEPLGDRGRPRRRRRRGRDPGIDRDDGRR